MHRFLKHLARAMAVQKGQDAAEYALLIGLIALAIVIAVTLLGTNLATVFTQLAAGIPPF
jgi:pilus assembly protein Flp/PilA